VLACVVCLCVTFFRFSLAPPQEKEISELIDNPDVVTKYKAAAEIANAVMNIAREKCVEGGKISELCALLDGEIETRTSALYRKNKQMLKGVAFPACLSVNEIVGHYSPLADGKDPDTVLKAGDVVKCDLGAHFDGFMALCAETFVVAAPGAKFEGRKADVILAAWYAQEAALRTLKPGNTNEQVTEVINRIAADFKCTMVQGVLSHKVSCYCLFL
jgi:curved DNA binding protein